MTETLVLNDGTVDVTFVNTKLLSDGRQRINDETDLLAPETLVIRHSNSKGGQGNPADAVVDRHLISLSRVERDSETNQAYTATVNLTIAVPRSSLFTPTEVDRLVTLVKAAITGNVNAVMRGES